MDKFHEDLKKWFAGQGIKQTDIAERLNISPTIVNNYLNGQRMFGKNVAMKWSNEFGLNPLWLMSGGTQGNITGALVTITANEDIINIPIINLDVRGGLLPNVEADVEQYTIDTMPFSRKIATEGDVVVPVYGDSMSPRYPSGSHILIRPLPLWREWLELGQSYVLELSDWRRTIKIVRKGGTNETYRLECYNVDYDATEIPKSLIEHIWQVLMCVKREVM